jgi:hypothetical protein
VHPYSKKNSFFPSLPNTPEKLKKIMGAQLTLAFSKYV